MSQAGHISIAAAPNVATTFRTENGDAVPVANQIDIGA